MDRDWDNLTKTIKKESNALFLKLCEKFDKEEDSTSIILSITATLTALCIKNFCKPDDYEKELSALQELILGVMNCEF